MDCQQRLALNSDIKNFSEVQPGTEEEVNRKECGGVLGTEEGRRSSLLGDGATENSGGNRGQPMDLIEGTATPGPHLRRHSKFGGRMQSSWQDGRTV